MLATAKRKRYSCDFETTTESQSQIDGETRIWAYGWMEIGNKKNFHIGESMDEFMRWALKQDAELFYHNLKFDGSFIVNWLLKNNYRFILDKDVDGYGEIGTFSAMISNMGQWYNIDIFWGRRGGKKPQAKHTNINDSLKKLPFTVAKIAKDFNLPIMKGSIDYDLYRPVGHKITPLEYDYIKNDIEIIADALEIQFNQGMNKMTIGSDAMNEFKNIISPTKFKKLFPVLDGDIDRCIRWAYKGGFTWVNDRHQGKMIGEGMTFDVNSLYPAMMRTKLLPWGIPIKYEGEYVHDEQYPLYIQHLRCGFEILEDKIPTIQIKKGKIFSANEYLKSSDDRIVDLYVTNVDLALIKEHYRLYDVTYMAGYKFRQKAGIFDEYIDKWMEVKKTSSGAIKQIAKLFLNSLYGKFASGTDVTGKGVELGDDGQNRFYEEDERTRKPVYTAMGAFITSYARDYSIRTAQSVFSRFLYMDTDSLHIMGTEVPEAIKDIIDDNEIGYWKHECTFSRALFVRAKTYIEEIDGHLDVKCAGMPSNIKKYVTFENFRPVQEDMYLPARDGYWHGKLLPKQINGGVILQNKVFTIKGVA